MPRNAESLRWRLVVIFPMLRPLPVVSVPPRLRRVALSEFFKVEGNAVERPDGMLRITSEQSRAQSARSDSKCKLRIRYLGPSDTLKPLDDGEMRVQAALRIRYEDICNCVTIGWRIKTTSEISVQLKLNPGKTTSSQCGSSNYTTVNPTRRVSPLLLGNGTLHVLAAEQSATGFLVVTADGLEVWKGQLPPEALKLRPAVGFRTDNGAFDLELWAP